MCLFHLIKQHYAVGLAAHSLCKLSALIIAHISWRRSNETCHRMLLHIFAHINAHHIGFIIKQ